MYFFYLKKKRGPERGPEGGPKRGPKGGSRREGPRFVYSTWKKCSFVYSFVCFLSFFTL